MLERIWARPECAQTVSQGDSVMAKRTHESQCPDCGSRIETDPWGQGLCPACLMELALDAPSLLGELEQPEEAPTVVFTEDGLSQGQILGNRYRIRSLLGRGGMGEVWRAFDLKLRVDVALKTLREHLLTDQRALEALRGEVRTARGVVSPNVCRVFDLEEMEGQELVSMEYVDGITLLEILRRRGPLELEEAREIASQFLAGLEAIHGAGLVHRDLKPENIMRTRSGRVVVMDFGIAKGLAEDRTGTISGTPAYMAPEQSRGEAVDARADVFSAGVVLAEMIAPAGVGDLSARQALWHAVHHDPPELPDSPWKRVLDKALAHNQDRRYTTASSLARALEEVTLRIAGAEDLHPYPGLASFSTDDAKYFFGREYEVESLWKKLRRPHLLALIGPSGAGKSSFLRAGLLPAMPEGWRALVATPGNQPMMTLGLALADQLVGDRGATRDLLRFEELDVAVSLISRWRQQHDQALIILDQFEELFTQNAPEVQGRFVDLLSRMALESDVHILLSMRDDFLFHCHDFEPLAPLFSEMTPLGPPKGTALRRAIVQPALKCGYKFEDESLVDEMVSEVEGERGALPMLAFAASQLWERRDREQGLLTREAYEAIGGVGGALAQHAEKSLEKIGQDRIPTVREIFRNLVTSQGTRAARDRSELLSVFLGPEPPKRPVSEPPDGPSGDDTSAEEVLDTLIDARLLTSYEVAAVDDGEGGHTRVEIIHESLLSNWPRLVHWQTQDQEGTLLRDQLRQAAQMWEERDRPQDLLWTGTSFKEYELWRERYGGGISAAEDEFASAMIRKAERRKRQRRMVITAAFVLLIAVLGVFATLWRQSELSRQRAENEALRAEGQKLIALGRLELERFPTATLAYATASLELADTPEARRLILETLWRGPTARQIPQTAVGMPRIAFSPDDSLLGATGTGSKTTLLVHSDGSAPIEISTPLYHLFPAFIGFGEASNLLVTSALVQREPNEYSREARIVSLPEGDVVRKLDLPLTFVEVVGRNLVTHSRGTDRRSLSEIAWELLDGTEPATRLVLDEEALHRSPERGCQCWAPDPSLDWIALVRKRTVLRRELVPDGAEEPLWELDFDPTDLRLGGDKLAACRMDDESGIDISVFDMAHRSARSMVPPPSSHAMPAGYRYKAQIDTAGSVLAWGADLPEGDVSWVWRLDGPPHLEPLTLMPQLDRVTHLAISHDGRWMVMSGHEAFSFFSLEQPYSQRLRSDVGSRLDTLALAFSQDSLSLASCSFQGGTWIWPLDPNGGEQHRIEELGDEQCASIEADPTRGGFVAANYLSISLVSSNGSELTPIEEQVDPTEGAYMASAVDPTGRLLAAYVHSWSDATKRSLRIWDLETGEMREFSTASRGPAPTVSDESWGRGSLSSLGMAFDGSLYSAGVGGLWRWDLESGTAETIYGGQLERALLDISDDGRTLIAGFGAPTGDPWMVDGVAVLFDLEAGAQRPLRSHGSRLTAVSLNPSGEIVLTGDMDGVVRVGLARGDKPHMLVGHRAPIRALAISPDGKWIASAAGPDIRLWPMPDLDKPPLHTLPLDDLLGKLHDLTNLRVVRDPDMDTGWRQEIGPFPGWEVVPAW